MMKYENLMNKRYKEPEDGKFVDATKEILKAVSGDSNIDYHKEMEPVFILYMYVYLCLWTKKFFSRTLAINSPFQTSR